MTTLWIIFGAIIGGGLGWLFDRRFIKRNNKDEKPQEQQAPT